MKTVETPFTPSQAEVPSAYSIYKRIANLVLVVFAVVVCINLWLFSSTQAQSWYDKQADQLGRSLVQQGARSMREALINKDTDKIQAQLAALALDPHVAAAALYGYKGRLMASTGENVSLLANFRTRENMPLVFVEEVIHDQQIRGYLRLLLDEASVIQHHKDYQQQLYQQMLVLMLLSAAGGMLLARIFYKFRYRKHVKPEAKQKAE